jgi:hypothetical protein
MSIYIISSFKVRPLSFFNVGYRGARTVVWMLCESKERKGRRGEKRETLDWYMGGCADVAGAVAGDVKGVI